MKPFSQWVPPTNDRPRPKFIAQTLADLKSMCGRHGRAAVADARYAAALMWIMNQPDFVGGIELHQAAQYARYKLDLPSNVRQPKLPNLALLSASERQAVMDVAEGVLSDWEAAGSPHLRGAISRTHQMVLALRARQAKRESAMLAVDKVFNEREATACHV